MRRFSQRNSLVTLNDINITPLLDLAFVLLLIFIITRPMLTQTIDLNLPKGGQQQGKIDARNVQTIEVTPQGAYKLNGRGMSLDQVMDTLEKTGRSNPKMVIAVRVDENGPNKHTLAVIDECQKRKISVPFAFVTKPESRP